jgi:intracellular septation protein A
MTLLLPHPRLIGLLWIFLSATGFGAMPIFARFAYADGVDLPSMLFLRFTLAGVLMAATIVQMAIIYANDKKLTALHKVTLGLVLGFFVYPLITSEKTLSE